MTWIAQTLWDLLRPPQRPEEVRQPGNRAKSEAGNRHGPRHKRTTSMQQRYDALVVEMKQRFGIRVRKWRSSTSGCAWEVHYDSGEMVRLIESPYPRGPMSCAVFLHEIGHHAIGFRTYRPRCLEEYHAWRWALDAMRERRLNVTPAVEKRMHEALRHAVRKAKRRGLRCVPAELMPFA